MGQESFKFNGLPTKIKPTLKAHNTKDKYCMFLLMYDISEIGKITETESRIRVTSGWEEG